MFELIDKFKKNWFISLFSLCVIVAVGTWGAAYQLYVEPRNFQIALLEKEINGLKNQISSQVTEKSIQQLAVREGEAEAFANGRCLILVNSVTDKGIELTVTDRTKYPIVFKDLTSGSQINSGLCHVNVLRKRGNLVDLNVSLDAT